MSLPSPDSRPTFEAETFNASQPLPDAAPTPARVGRYVLEGVLGRGGLGIVYRGFDPALKRPVAVKMILADRYAAPDAQARFRVEAEAVARLDHPNITRVYEVGEDDGHPFLALELVDGPTLAAVLADAPLAPANAARLVEAVARAVAHAHEQGVVHRDLKPANVLLNAERGMGNAESKSADGSDSTLRVPHSALWTPKVADFGLAKQLQESDDLTQTGMILGTPAYMAPEQAAGDARTVGPTADVWALGAILYECLTGRPPFRGVTPFATVDLVRSADPVSPRVVQPGVPRDLSVVCLKCLEKEPAKRYATAAALADDLRRFLDGRPILARPVGPVARAVKWVRRNPAAAALTAVVGLVPIAAAVGVAVHTARLQDALEQKTREEERATAEKQRADDNDRQARAALRKMLDRLSDRRYAGVPRVTELHRAQAEDALVYFRTVAARRDDPSPEVRFDAALADLDVAKLTDALGRRDEAIGYARRGAAALARLADEFPDDRRYRFERAFADLWLGSNVTPSDGIAENVRLLTGAADEFRRLAAEPGANIHDRNALANTVNAIGAVYHVAGRMADAAPYFREAFDLRTAMAAERPGDPEVTRQLAENALNLGICYQNINRPDEAARLSDQAADALRALVEADPDDRAAAADLAVVRVNRSYALEKERRVTESIDQLTRALAPLERLNRLEPGDARVRDALFRLHGRRGELYQRTNRLSDAVHDAEKAVGYVSADKRRFHRWFLARYRSDAGDVTGCLTELEGLLREFPAGVPVAELRHAAETATLTARRSRARAAVVGGFAAAEVDRAEALAAAYRGRMRR